MQAIDNLRKRYRAAYWLWIEAFVLFNFLVLAVDIYIAHSANQFRRREEYLPLYFSIFAAPILAFALFVRERRGWLGVWRHLGYFIGWISVLIGVAGVVFHLDSQFFYEKTLRSITYAAPFAAPLTYAGLGLLLILNRMLDVNSKEWGYWLLLFAGGGYFGNFILSLTDHAANGFFRPVEWLPVISGAFAASFLIVPLLMPVSTLFLRATGCVVFFQVVVGLLGFFFHARENLHHRSVLSFEDIVNGAPPLAPLLFLNLVPLALIGLLVLHRSGALPARG